MAQRRTKRKHNEHEPVTEPSIQDTHVAHSNTRAGPLNALECLRDELLRNKPRTKEEQEKCLNHIAELEKGLKSVKPEGKRTTFSKVTPTDLTNAGVVGKNLEFCTKKIDELLQRFTEAENREISDLRTRIKKIYAHVNMDFEASSRMILDTILLSLAEVASLDKRGIVIFAEMRIPSTNEVQITHPTSGFGLELSGSVDYAVIELPNTKGDKTHFLEADAGSVHDALKFLMGCFFLVKAKRQSGPLALATSAPEAVSQAVSLLLSSKLRKSVSV